MLEHTLNAINDFFWSIPFIAFVIFVGAYFTIGSKFFTLVHFGHIIKHTFMSMFRKDAHEKSSGHVSPFEAICVSVGGNVGMGTIGGVTTAVATGGPGAVFWMWLWAFFGMMVKMVETTLGCYYRSRNERGEYYGGGTYMLEKGIAHELHHRKFGTILAVLFGVGFVAQFLGGSQVYTISEILNTSFGINQMLVTVLYTALLYYVIYHGIPGVAKFEKYATPFKCLLYLVGCFFLIVFNYQNIPHMFYLIFHDAFTGTAAVGGFAGATIAKVIGDGVARSINANEAGQGSSPFIYGSADTAHPVRQALWASFDVFVNTMIVCSLTALCVIATGVWDSGIKGASLSIAAFETAFGFGGDIFLGIVAILFGITVTSGWFTFYVAVINHGFRSHPILRDRLIKIFKLVYPIPNLIIVGSIVYTGNGPDLFWTIVNITLIAPVATNLLGLFVLRKKFWALFKDYKARYMGIGEVDPNFYVFYEDDPNVFNREEAIRRKAREIESQYQTSK